MLALSLASYLLGSRKVRFELNAFTWHPILEVGALFAGIFLTMIPALRVAAQLAPSLPVNEVSLFASTASLSSVLDNAPTYALFFEIAKGLGGTDLVAGVSAAYLASISLGAVMGGGMTYIGNGPNFMVKSIAESSGVTMPSFGAYVARYAPRLLRAGPCPS